MDEVKALPETLSFRLGALGAIVGERYAARLERLGLKPKHAGLLTALSTGPAASQQDLAVRLGVVPSLVVSLADHLEHVGAIERVRDPHDRRRQVLTLTETGRALLAACMAEAVDLDTELSAALTPPQRQALHESLGILATRAGLPT
ncbi:hypothetical protein GCM10027589_37030 [Actinocorallia lasiicapitis]